MPDSAPPIGPGLRAYQRIADAWLLTDGERCALIGVDPRTMHAWGTEPPAELSPEQLLRLSYLLGVYEGLARVFRRSPALAGQWMRTPREDAPFVCQTPVAFAVAGGLPALAALRAYIDRASGGPG